MSTIDLTGEDMFLSLTGFDEIAVVRAFGSEITSLREKPLTFMRALAFVDLRRKGQKDNDAHRAAMNLTVAELQDYFAPQSEDVMVDETEPGKGD